MAMLRRGLVMLRIMAWEEGLEREGIAYKAYLQMLVLGRLHLMKGNRHSIWVPML